MLLSGEINRNPDPLFTWIPITASDIKLLTRRIDGHILDLPANVFTFVEVQGKNSILHVSRQRG